MKEDKLEEWIKQNRSSLDTDTPDDDAIWEGIRSGLQEKKKTNRNWLYWAAILIPTIGLSTYLYLSFNHTGIDIQTAQNTRVSLASIGPEWATLETNYQQDIKAKWAKIESHQFDKEKLDFLFEELGILDEVNTEYQTNISKTENERLLRTLIDYYEKKTQLLERILIEIEREKRNRYEIQSIEL